MYNRKYILLLLVSLLIVIGHYQYVKHIIKNSKEHNYLITEVYKIQLKNKEIVNLFSSKTKNSNNILQEITDLELMLSDLYNNPKQRYPYNTKNIILNYVNELKSLINQGTENTKVIQQNENNIKFILKGIEKELIHKNEIENSSFANTELLITIFSILFIILSLLYFTKPLLEDLKHKNNKLKNVIFELQKQSNEISEFSYVISHDIQEPISTINEIVKNDTFNKHEIKELVSEQTGRIDILVRELIIYNQSSIKTNQNTCNLRRSFKSNLKLLGLSNNTKLEIDKEIEIPMNCSDLNLLLNNLLKNCSEFRKRDVPLEILVSSSSNDDEITFNIEDNGLGIPNKKLPQVFNIFMTTKKQKPGEINKGLGLSISRKIVNDYAGSISILSELGRKTIVSITLPFNK